MNSLIAPVAALDELAVLAVYVGVGFSLLASVEWLLSRPWWWVRQIDAAADRLLGGSGQWREDER